MQSYVSNGLRSLAFAGAAALATVAPAYAQTKYKGGPKTCTIYDGLKPDDSGLVAITGVVTGASRDKTKIYFRETMAQGRTSVCEDERGRWTEAVDGKLVAFGYRIAGRNGTEERTVTVVPHDVTFEDLLRYGSVVSSNSKPAKEMKRFRKQIESEIIRPENKIQ